MDQGKKTGQGEKEPTAGRTTAVRAAAGPGRGSARGRRSRLLRDDDGAATAEFAVVTMAAVGFAGLLVVILRSDEVRQILTDLVRDALSVGM